MKNMTFIPTAQSSLGLQTLNPLAEALTPLFSTDDLQFLDPALIVTATLVQIDNKNVVTSHINKAIGDLPKINPDDPLFDALLAL